MTSRIGMMFEAHMDSIVENWGSTPVECNAKLMTLVEFARSLAGQELPFTDYDKVNEVFRRSLV